MFLANAPTSESLSQPSGDNESQASRSPNTMPLPSAPRRAAPPRKKAVKSPMPPAVDMEAPLTEVPDILSVADTPVITKKAEADDVEQKIGEVTSDFIEPSGHPEVAEDPSEVLEEGAVQVHDHEDEKPVHVVPPSHAPDVPDDAKGDGDEETSAEIPAEYEPSPARLDEGIKESMEQPADETVDEEAARRKRVADKLAKMGGINPLAPPVQRKSSVDESQTSSPVSPVLVKRASISRQSTDTLPALPRTQSLRKSSISLTTAPEEGATGLRRNPSVDETQTSPPVSPLTRRASLSRQSMDSPQRRQSLRNSSVDSTTVLEANIQEYPTRSSAISPQSRKSSVDPAVSASESESVSRESQDGKY